MEQRYYVYRHRDYLDIARRRARYTQRDAAEQLGISLSLYRKMEYGQRRISPRLLFGLCDLFGHDYIMHHIARDPSTAHFTLIQPLDREHLFAVWKEAEV